MLAVAEEKTPEQLRTELVTYSAHKLTLSRTKERTRQLQAENEALRTSNAALKKQIEEGNKIAECKEQMSTFYYNQEIDALNEIVKSLIDKSNVRAIFISRPWPWP